MTNNKCSCELFAIVGSIIIGVIAAILTFAGVITASPVFLWVFFGVALIYLGLILVITSTSRLGWVRECFVSLRGLWITGIIGTLVTAALLLAVRFPATSVFGAIAVGALSAFFSLLVSSAVCLVDCLSKRGDN